jgi:predicted ATPase
LGLDATENGIILKEFKIKNRFKSFLEALMNEPLNFNIYYLPASRSGLYQGSNSLGEIFAELSQKRSFISKKISIPSYSEPVSDYLLTLFSIERTDINRDFAEYINEIEQEILQGIVEFNPETKKIYFTPNNTTLRLDVALSTSSMVAEIAPIVAYLKHVLSITCVKDNKQTVLFIEEPEAHLHPETQVKLMRVFARLVKDNKIKLVMTSHSNYIFNAASNLVMDNKIDSSKFEAVLFEMKEEGSVARPMATDEYGIDDDNFIDVAESLYEEKIELINKLNG